MKPEDHLKDGSPIASQQMDAVEEAKQWLVKDGGASCIFPALGRRTTDFEIAAPSSRVYLLTGLGVLATFVLVALLLISCVPDSPKRSAAPKGTQAPTTKGHTIFVLKNGTVVIDPANQK